MNIDLAALAILCGMTFLAAIACAYRIEGATDVPLIRCPALYGFCLWRTLRAVLYFLACEYARSITNLPPYSGPGLLGVMVLGFTVGYFPRAKGGGVLQIAGHDIAVMIATVFAPFDAVLLSALTQFVDDEIAKILAPYEERFWDAPTVKEWISAHIDRDSYNKRIKSAKSGSEAMEQYLRVAGKAKFKRDIRHFTPP